MPDLQKLQQNKERIMHIIRGSGPSLPAKISRETGISPLFASAFLSELTSERKLRISNMKVGSSPIYFIEGQESSLEKFVDYLNPKEREAFQILKDGKVLNDEQQEPAIRVALRKINDFAHPINVRVNGEIKLFWKFFTLKDDELKGLLEEKITGKREIKVSEPVQNPEPQKVEVKETEIKEEVQPKEEHIKKEQKTEEVNKSQRKEETSKSESETKKEEKIIEKTKQKSAKKVQEPNEFGLKIKDYLKAKDIEVIEEISDKKKEFISKVRADTLFGKQEFYLLAKDKKNISDTDITIAYQQAQSHKMPALLVSPGNLNKKAESHLNEWKNLVKFEKVKI